MDNTITVHPLSSTPTEAWQELSKTQKCTLLQPKSLIQSEDPEFIRIVCMSDTHSEDDKFKFTVPNGDVFIHAGDFSRWGEEGEIVKFNQWMKSLPHRYKIVIAGNHELGFDPDCLVYGGHLRKNGVEAKKKLLTDCIYLEDSFVTVHGLKIYGAPWQPEYAGMAFNIARGQTLLNKWNLIPEDTDILVTHGPPLGFGDLTHLEARVGCLELLSTVQKRVKPKYHIFGHIHEAYGASTDGTTVFINASTCNRRYLPVNLPIVFDVKGTRNENEKRLYSPSVFQSAVQSASSFLNSMQFWTTKSEKDTDVKNCDENKT